MQEHMALTGADADERGRQHDFDASSQATEEAIAERLTPEGTTRAGGDEGP